MTANPYARIVALEKEIGELALKAERCRLIVDSTPECVKVLSPDGRVMEMNPAGLSIVGAASFEEVAGKPVARFVAENDRPAFTEFHQRLVEGASGTLEFDVVRLDGERRRLEMHAVPLRGPSGAVTSILSLTRDVTASRALQKELQESRDRLRALIDGLGPGMFVGLMTPDGVLVEANRPALDLVGLTREEILGTPMWSLYSFAYSEEAQRAAREAVASAARGEPWRMDVEILVAHGRSIQIDLSVEPLRDGGGTIVFLVGSAVDVTERRQNERALRESEDRYRDLVEKSGVLICTHDLDGRFLTVNEAAVRATGYPAERLLAMGIGELLASSVREEVDDYLGRLRRDGSARGLMKIRTATGEIRVWEYDNTVRTEGVPRPVVRGIARDITEQRAAEQAARKNDLLLRNVVEMLPVGVWITDEKGTIVLGNRAGQEIWGGARYVGINGYGEYRGWWTATGKPIAAGEWASARAIQRGETSIEEMIDIEGFDGTRKTILNSALPMRDSHGTIHGAIVVNQDVTERVRAEESLRSAHDRLRSLSHQQLTVRETERRHLARELHDEVGQVLTATKINLSSILRKRANADAKLEESIDLLNRALGQVRAISLELRPQLLDDAGLAVAVRWLAEQQSRRTSVRIQVETPLNERFDPAIEIACFRIAQEALSNALRHAAPMEVRVSLALSGGALHLHVEDDGAGFDTGSARARAAQGESLGLIGMEERAALAGGTIEIDSRLGGGTRIRVRFPLSPVHIPEPAGEIPA